MEAYGVLVPGLGPFEVGFHFLMTGREIPQIVLVLYVSSMVYGMPLST